VSLTDRPATSRESKLLVDAPLDRLRMAEVAIPRQMFQEILRLIAELRPKPPPAPA
jgi:hypothetical protein